MTELDHSQSKLLGALTIAAAQRLGGDTMLLKEANGMRELTMARVDVNHPADATGPRSINVYHVDLQDFADISGVKLKLDPQCLLYSLQWRCRQILCWNWVTRIRCCR